MLETAVVFEKYEKEEALKELVRRYKSRLKNTVKTFPAFDIRSDAALSKYRTEFHNCITLIVKIGKGQNIKENEIKFMSSLEKIKQIYESENKYYEFRNFEG